MDDIKESWSRFDASTWSALWLIAIIFVIMTILIIICNIALRKHKPEETPNKLVNFVMYFSGGMKNLIDENMGKRFRFLGPYLMFIMTFYLISVSLGFFGMPVAITYLSIPLTLAVIMISLSWGFAIKDYGLKFFKLFISPMSLLGEFSQVFSMTFRIFGNILAGTIILTLINMVFGLVQNLVFPAMSDWNFLGPIVAAPLRMYFDVFAGLIQAYIFTILTVIYISLAVKPEDELSSKIEDKKQKKKIKSVIKREEKQELQKALQA